MLYCNKQHIDSYQSIKSSFSIYTAAFDVPINVTSLIEGAINSVSATGVPGAEEEMLPVIGCAGPVCFLCLGACAEGENSEIGIYTQPFYTDNS